MIQDSSVVDESTGSPPIRDFLHVFHELDTCSQVTARALPCLGRETRKLCFEFVLDRHCSWHNVYSGQIITQGA